MVLRFPLKKGARFLPVRGIMPLMEENELIIETEHPTENQPAVQPEPEVVASSGVVSRSVGRPRVPRHRPPASTVPTEFLWLILPVIFALGLGTGWLLWGRVSAPESQAADTTRYTVDEAGNPAIGPADAPVKIIEFSDYQCPYCKRWYDAVNSRLLSDYAGKIRFVYRDMPLSAIHPEAQSAAEAANCAAEQIDYWKYHDLLFTGQYGLGSQAYSQYATDLGLNMDTFNTCVAERRYQSEVDNDASVGLNLGVTGTPTFFINGLKVVGAQPYEVFKQIIDNELASAPPKN